jgi:ADP-ribose pyrophosphatase YjhB (NUDIX family)
MSDRAPLMFRLVEAVETQLRRRATPGQLRLAYRLGYLLLRPVWFVTRPHTRGVKAVVRCGERVLLVRHTYARRGEWDIPGGFLHPGENPEVALRRELAEELGVTPTAVTTIAVTPSRFDHKREQLYIFVVDVADETVRVSEAEIAEGRWFQYDALPERTGRFARRMVARSAWEYWTHLPDDEVAGEAGPRPG